MHSRIIELSKDPILKHERMCESSVPDWFYHSIADYTDADTDRDHDIKWFLDAEAKYDIGMAMYKLNEHYQDKFSLYVYFNDELKSLDEWIRETDLSGSFYFGGTLDYHY